MVVYLTAVYELFVPLTVISRY